ncbi:early nodulin-like protein 1 [Perilla frutescens var. hirtella]|uniref:Early nodulin-like protein 1 n=1 Tax=Perilla frutescens var. hirtella TaxID=608512 RepID=A0AAD4JKI6_PERFH|nr:early nodulin-like protein 1 [Perilla frutescens var. hirtella]
MGDHHRNFLLFLALFSCVAHSSYSYQFVVGGKNGWVVNPSENYNQWSGRMRFQVNDTLLFKYKSGTDSVLVVNKDDYDKCNTANPSLKLDDGNSIFKLDRSGPFYFISGNKPNCDQGQKLIVVVLSLRTPPSPPKVPSPTAAPPKGSSSSPPSSPGSSPPSPPSPSSGAPAPYSPISPNPSGGAPAPATSASSPSPSSETPAPAGSGPSPAGATPPEGFGPSPASDLPGSPSSSTTPGSPGSSMPGSGSPGASAPGSGTPADGGAPPPPRSLAAPPCSSSVLLVSLVLSVGWGVFVFSP